MIKKEGLISINAWNTNGKEAIFDVKEKEGLD